MAGRSVMLKQNAYPIQRMAVTEKNGAHAMAVACAPFFVSIGC
jgi:hypothetical protein